MRNIAIILLLLAVGDTAIAQKLPHGTVYGHKPGKATVIQADKLEKFMGSKSRVNVTVGGRITLVTKAKGGWFDMDAGNGKIITAHFKQAGITIPAALKNRYVIIEGVASKKFTPIPGAHYAGQAKSKTDAVNPKQMVFFEVRGLMVDK